MNEYFEAIVYFFILLMVAANLWFLHELLESVPHFKQVYDRAKRIKAMRKNLRNGGGEVCSMCPDYHECTICHRAEWCARTDNVINQLKDIKIKEIAK